MKSVEQQKQAVTSMIRQLKRELDSMKRSGYEQARVYADAGSGRRVHYDRFDAKPLW